MFVRLIDQIRKNIIAISWASFLAFGAAWLESQLRELFKTYIYGWIVDHAKELVVEQEAIMIASLVTYAAPIITAVIVFSLVLWMWPRQKIRNIHHVEVREHIGIGTSISPVVAHSAIARDNELDGWGRLYELRDTSKGEELRLRFLPDTDDQASDALLLICYGYKIIKNVESISAKIVNSQIEYLLLHAPNTRESILYRLGNAMAFAQSERDFGAKCISQGNVERIGLSKGGFYRLTSWGEEKAKNLALDLIKRA